MICIISFVICRISLTMCIISFVICRISLTMCIISFVKCRISLTSYMIAPPLESESESAAALGRGVGVVERAEVVLERMDGTRRAVVERLVGGVRRVSRVVVGRIGGVLVGVIRAGLVGVIRAGLVGIVRPVLIVSIICFVSGTTLSRSLPLIYLQRHPDGGAPKGGSALGQA